MSAEPEIVVSDAPERKRYEAACGRPERKTHQRHTGNADHSSRVGHSTR